VSKVRNRGKPVGLIGRLQYILFTSTSTPAHKLKPLAVRMDKTKSKLAQFFDNDEEESSFPVRSTEFITSCAQA